MYTKLEILEIFNSATSMDDVTEISNAFKWLIDNNFITKSVFLYKVASEAFRRVT
jgi:hypothetical protein